MKKKQDDETKVYLVYDEELKQCVLKKGDDRTILEILDLKDPGTEKLLSILIKTYEREFVIDFTAYLKLVDELKEYSNPEEHAEYISSIGQGHFLIRCRQKEVLMKEINKEIEKEFISRGISLEILKLGGEVIELDSNPNSTHVNVFEMAGIDPKKVEENTKLVNDLINSMKE